MLYQSWTQERIDDALGFGDDFLHPTFLKIGWTS